MNRVEPIEKRLHRALFVTALTMATLQGCAPPPSPNDGGADSAADRAVITDRTAPNGATSDAQGTEAGPDEDARAGEDATVESDAQGTTDAAQDGAIAPGMDVSVLPMMDAMADVRADSSLAPDAAMDARVDATVDAAREAGAEAGADARADTGSDAGSGADSASDGGTTPMTMVALQSATASFSQASYGVGEAINGVIPSAMTSDGWGIATPGGATSAQSAVFETVTDTVSSPTGTRLTVRIHQTSEALHTLGAFRMQVTTANRAAFADGLGTGGDLGAPAIWTTLVPVAATTTAGTLTIRADHSLLAGGAAPAFAVYTVTFVTPASAITGVRLDLLEDPSLPMNGPGRSSGGNVVISELQVSAAPLGSGPTSTVLANATATASQPGYSPAEAINGVLSSGFGDGWAIDTGSTVAQSAVFELATSVPSAGTGTNVLLVLRQLAGMSHVIGRFRVSVTTANRAMFADGLASGGQLGPAMIWQPVTVLTSVTSAGGPLSVLADATIRATGAAPSTADYTLRVATPLEAITGIRIDVLEDPSFPDNGPGRSTSGNFVLSELEATVRAN